MLTALVVLLRSIGLICRGHRAVALENLALRQQLAALTRTVKRPHLRKRDRLFWILLAKGWREWRTALVVVQPDTVVRWHRQWLRRQLDAALHTDTSGPPQHGYGGSNARRHDGRGESAVGRASDSRRIVQAGHHGVGADGVPTHAAPASPPVTDVADLSVQSCRHAGVDGVLRQNQIANQAG
jgi:hypothetical protein